MALNDSEFSDSLFSVALAPNKLHSFIDTFNDVVEKFNNDEAAIKNSFSEEYILQAMSVADLLIDKETSKSHSIKHTIRNSTQPILALDSTGHIIEINNMATDIFSVTNKSKTFKAYLSESSRDELHFYLNKISALPLNADLSFIDLIELETKDDGLSHFVCVTPWKVKANQYFLLIQSVNIHWPEHMTPLLKTTFGLTQSESAVFRLLSEGMSVNDAAAQRKTSVATVRTQIREIYAKTGTTSQLQFIRLAVSLAALTFDSNIESPLNRNIKAIKNDAPYPREDQWRVFKLPDERQIEYAVFGDPKGAPCLFFHNELIGEIWPAGLAQYAHQKGLKIILPARPLYRGSSAYPNDAFHPTQSAHDFAKLLDYLKIPKVMVLAQTLGGMFALEFTSLYESRVSRLCIISPMLPFSSEAQRKNMPRLHRFVSTMILKSPKLLEFVARTGYALYLKDGPEAYLRLTFSSAPCDKIVLDNPKHLQSLCMGSQFSGKHGYQAYIAGWKHLLTDTEEKMKKIKVPMVVIIGDSDNNTRVERANSLIEKGIKLDVVMAEGGGELLVFSHPEIIIDSLINTAM